MTFSKNLSTPRVNQAETTQQNSPTLANLRLMCNLTTRANLYSKYKNLINQKIFKKKVIVLYDDLKAILSKQDQVRISTGKMEE